MLFRHDKKRSSKDAKYIELSPYHFLRKQMITTITICNTFLTLFFFSYEYPTNYKMHCPRCIKNRDAQQGVINDNYRKEKLKLLKANAANWYNKITL